MSIKIIKNRYQRKYNYLGDDFILHLSENDSNINIDLILFPSYSRGEGMGTEIIQDIIDYSKITGKTICITPATSKEDTKKWDIDKKRLLSFWDKFGFVKNIGKHKDFEITHSMYKISETNIDELKLELYNIIASNIDLSLMLEFDFEEFYIEVKKQLSKNDTPEDAIKNLNISKILSVFIEKSKVDTNYEFDETNVMERFGSIKQLKQLGKGSDRIVYELENGRSLKVNLNSRGEYQSLSESSFANEQSYMLDKKLLPDVFECGLDYLIVEQCIPYSALDSENKKKINSFLKPLKKFNQTDWENKTSEIQEVFEELGYSELVNYDLLFADFYSSRNWGMSLEGDILMLDGGTIGNPNFLREEQNTIRRNERSYNSSLKKIIPKIWKETQAKNKTPKQNLKTDNKI